jgi:glycosyl transferase family 87
VYAPAASATASAASSTGSRGHRLSALARRARTAPLVGALFLCGMAGCAALIVLDAAAAKSPEVPPSPHIASYLPGIGSTLSFRTFLILILVMVACYGGVLWCARAFSARGMVIGVVVLHAIVLAGPVLLSQDIFSYVAYARLGLLHGVDPFTHGPAAAATDPIFKYIGKVWREQPSAYGPAYTLISYPTALLGLVGALWTFKVMAVAASLATVMFVWLCARLLGRDPVVPSLVLGVNPLLIIYGVGGAHNDLLMAALMMAGVWMALRGHEGRGAATIVVTAAGKATAAVVLPYMLLARRRMNIVVGAVAGLVVISLVSYLVFGPTSLDFVSTLRRQQLFVSTDSFPTEVAHLLGYPGVFPVDRTIARGGMAIVLLYLMLRVWRGYDWIAASAWALLVIPVATTWLLAWYLLWGLPLAVLARDRRVLYATLAVQALFIAHQCAPLFSPVQ